VIKPVDRGSSVGVSIVEKKEHAREALKNAFIFSKNVMVQEYICGRELTCAVIEGKGGKPKALIPTEIMPSASHSFFDYKAKYERGASVEVTPPDLPKKTIEHIRQTAIKVHEKIGCSHISRVDFILKNDELYVLEINTIPGMTETSLVPQGAKAYGIEFPLLLEIIIEAALR
jgi:D-alanine-D-alanine ligase